MSEQSVAGKSRRVMVVGGSGLVGRALVAALNADPQVATIELLQRREVAEWADWPKLNLRLVADLAQAPRLPTVDQAFIALGSTQQQAGSPAAFRRVDLDMVVAVASSLRLAGCPALAVVSALGANPEARLLYPRTKGEMEQAVERLGFARLVIARPSLLAGDRSRLGQPPRPAERWSQRLLAPINSHLPAAWRVISADDVAAAMILALRETGPGLQRLSSAAMLGASARLRA